MKTRMLSLLLLSFLLAAPQSTFANPGVRLTHSTSTNVPSFFVVVPSFDTTQFSNSPGMHEPLFFPARIFIQEPGCYIGGFSITFSANATGTRVVTVMKSDNFPAGLLTPIYSATQNAVTVGPTRMNGEFYYCFDNPSGRTMFIQVYQDSGALLTISASEAYSPVFWAQKVREF